MAVEGEKGSMGNSVLTVSSLSVGYDGKPVVSDFNLDIAANEFVSLLGPSGCGKTTVLRTIAGFLPPLAGTIRHVGKDITRLPPERRDLGIVFQNYALFPTMTVFENIAFAPRVAKRPKAEIDEQVNAIAMKFGIEIHLAKKPAALSGGQQQRVAIARALIMGPKVLLFDEPFSNLDAKIRIAMRREIKRLQLEIGFTAIFITHDQEEALSLSDTIVVLNDGRVEQIGSGCTLYRAPATPFICQFMGQVNELSAAMACRLAGKDFSMASRIFLRYEDLLIADKGVPAKITQVEFLGAFSRIDVIADCAELSLLSCSPEVPSVGEEIHLAVRPGGIHVFNGDVT